MAHIDLGSRATGRLGPKRRNRDTTSPKTRYELAEDLLPTSCALSRGERELIATVVADHDDQVVADPARTPAPAKLRALLRLAHKTRTDAKSVTADDADAARAAGATEQEIQDAMVIATAFWLVA